VSWPSRPFFVSAGLGLVVGLRGGNAQFGLEEAFGFHVLPVNEHPGLFVALALNESFVDTVVLEATARTGFDLQLFASGDLAIRATPYVGLGAGVVIADTPAGNQTLGAFDLQLGAEARLVLAQGSVEIWLRPLAFDFLIRDGGSERYTLMAGVQFDF
jgi:hypothetical protein